MLSVVGLSLAFSNSSQSADRASRIGELLLAQAGPVLGAPGAQAPPALPTPTADDDDQDASPAGGEVQTRGPVHEAFARPVEMNAEPGPVIAKRPPDPIEEVPPDAAPEGENVQWISGYWAWDDDRNDFIWISGVFRNSPPRQTWVAGYWSEVPGGYQWTSGFWATPGGNGNGATNDAVQYIAEAPPPSQEVGPSSPQPSENHFWVPGTWVYRQTNYAWQPGYWTPCQENWVFTPAQYVWTPAGYVFVPGYWDYAVARRGCLFAPVYFPQPVYVQPAYAYRPSVLINIGLFDDCLFVRPRYCHYYVGDYFAPSYATYGFRPWFSAGVRVGNVGIGINNGFGYDPLFVYANWHNSRNNRNWVADRQRHFDDLRDNPGRRPPQTFAAQQALIRKGGAGDRRDQQIAATIKQVEKDPNRGGVKMRDLSASDRQEFVKQSKDFKVVTQERAKLEKDNVVSGLVDGSGNARRNRTADGNGKDGVAGIGNNDLPVNAKTLKLPTVAANKVSIGDVGGKNNSGNNTGDKGTLGNLPANGDGNKLSNDMRRQGKGSNNDNDDTPRTNRKSLTDATKNPSGNDNRGNGANKGVGNLGGIANGNNTGNSDSNTSGNTRSRLGTTGQGFGAGNSSNATGNGTLGQAQGGNTTTQGGDSNSNSANRTRTRTGTGTTALGGNDNKSNNLGNNNPGNLGNNNPGSGNDTNGAPTTRRSTTNPNSSANGSNSGGNNSGAGTSKSRTLGSTNSMTMPNGSNGIGQGNSSGGNPSLRSNIQSDSGNSTRSTRSSGGGGGDSNSQPTVRSFNPSGGGGGNLGAGGGGGGGNASNSGRSSSNSSNNNSSSGGGNSKSSQSKQDDDNNKRNNKRSENSPRTNTDLMPSSERALVDSGRGLAIERKALKDASSAGKDDLAELTKSPFAPNKDELNLDLPQERRKTDGAASNSSPGAWRVPTLQTLNRGSARSTLSQNGTNGPSSDLSAGGDAAGKNQTSRGSGLTLKSAKDNAKANSDPSGGYAASAGSSTRPGQGPSLSGSKSAYDYQALAQRGQSISQNSGLAVGSNGGSSGSPLDRTTKDPVTKFGLGDRTMYGPGGLPGASSPSSSPDATRGSGSYMSSSSLPTLSKWQRSSSTGTVQNFDPSGSSSRSYDPAAQSR